METLFLGRDLSYEGNSPFYNIKTLKNVTISNSVTSIGGRAFDGCTGLTSVKIPNSVTSIEYYAFSGCSGLTSITIPNGVTSIGSSAFSGCTNLRLVINCSNLTFSIGSTNHGYVAYYANRIIDVQNCLIDGNFIFGTINGVNTLVGYYGDDTKLTLPADYKGGNYAICDYAFSGCTELASIEIPNNVTSIGNGVFSSCSGLTSVTIGNGVTSIGNCVFSGCSGLTSVTIGNGVTSIGNSMFSGCSGLTSVTIPNSVTSIGSSMFSGCSGLTSVTISNSATSIGSSMFSGCTGLTSVKIPNSVTSIGSSAFSGCSGLTSVTIPNSVTSIGSSAFSGCSGLTSVKIPNSVTSIGGSAFSGCTGLTSVTIPNSVTSIGYAAFDECTNLKELCIEDGGETLYLRYNSTNEGLFYDCPLETLYLGRDLSYDTSYSYGYSPFYKIKTLKSVTICNSVTSIGDYAFYGCSGLTSITIGNSVTSIEDDAFYKCSNLKKAIWLTNTPPTGYENVGATINYVANDQYSGLSNVKVYPYLSSLFEVGGVKYVPVSPAERTCDAIDCVYDSTAVDINIEKTVLFKGIAMNVKQVMPYTFYANKNIKTIKVENDGIVGNYAFNGCTSLNSATISNNGSIGYYAFCDCSSLVTATLGDSIASIGASAFYGCSKLSEIVIPDAVTAIGSEAFRYCTSLETVKVGNGTKSINRYAFGGCSALSSITLGDSVTTIGSNAFYACSSLPEIVIPQSVTEINSYAFDNCTALADVIIEDRATALWLGSNDSSPLFSDCPLDSVYIGGKITYSTSSSYGYSPFYHNTSLRSVVITDTEEEVYDNEFYGCSNLKNVSIGNGVKKIGNRAFSGCSALDYFAFGKSVQSIGEEAFSDCNNVTQIISRAKTPPTCGAQALDDINKWNCTLWVPEKYKAEYQSAEQWKEFFFVEGIAAQTYTVTFIVDGEVYDTLSVEYGEKITLPDTPVKEGHTFRGWSGVPEIMPAEDITITGTFTVNTYVVTYIVDGTVYVTDSIAYGAEIVPRDEPTKEGHTFSGWSEAPEIMPAEDIVIEGSFSVNSYTITYKVDGEVYATDSIAYGSEIVLRDEPVKEGHTFSGWSDVPETMPANDITIEGTFSINSYTVTFMIDGEVYETATVEFGAEIELPTPPEKEGYIFGGWVGVPDSMPAQDVVIEGEYIVDTTGINDVKAENGKVKGVYDLQGRKVENPTNGIYIVNGKKVFVK
ncbi:MAG: hypothetical protein E7093_03515 [Bacteroidales bacterium]|nr:hypothetical protein [Bacteroidales bacterium]